MDVSIVMPLYAQKLELINRIDLALKKQKFKGKVQIIKVDESLGLSDSINFGIKKAKYPIIVTLHQDCIPSSNNWLAKLTEPFKDEKIVASVSKVYMPPELWNSFDLTSKILSAKEQQLITPLMDEKGCAYRKSALIATGLFDGKTFETAGEDFDMYLKLKKLGEIAYPETKVIHNHHYNWQSRLRKEFQLANAFGALVRIYGKRMPNWYVGLIKSIPIIGYPLFLYSLNIRKLRALTVLGIPLMLVINCIYSYAFWKGFLMGQQTR
jgi:glycosyltransferase involved in cell wall biosynthesis